VKHFVIILKGEHMKKILCLLLLLIFIPACSTDRLPERLPVLVVPVDYDGVLDTKWLNDLKKAYVSLMESPEKHTNIAPLVFLEANDPDLSFILSKYPESLSSLQQMMYNIVFVEIMGVDSTGAEITIIDTRSEKEITIEHRSYYPDSIEMVIFSAISNLE